MQLTSGIMIASGLCGFLACTVWLLWCASRDGAIPDALVLMTGLPIVSYLFTQWPNARRPALGILLSAAAVVAGAVIKNVHLEADEPGSSGAEMRFMEQFPGSPN
jgi:hypothetical protein